MLDSDIPNGDAQLYVEFYTAASGDPYVRILTPGDQTNVFDQPARDHHKERFPRQWLHYAMQNSDASVIGTPLAEWHAERPEEFSDTRLAEFQIMKFQTVEQVATASDHQVQRIGMGGVGLREKARQFLAAHNASATSRELEETRAQVAAQQAQMAALQARIDKLNPPRRAAR